MTKYLDKEGLDLFAQRCDDTFARKSLVKVVYANHAKLDVTLNPSVIKKGVSSNISAGLEVGVAGDDSITGNLSIKSSAGNYTLDDNNILNVALTTNATTTVTYSASLPYDIKLSSTKTVTAVDPTYTFVGDATTPTASQILKGKEVLKTSGSGSYTFSPAEGQYTWVCTPFTINKATMGGFDYPLASVKTQSVTLNGHTTTYNCYKSFNSMAASTITINYS